MRLFLVFATLGLLCLSLVSGLHRPHRYFGSLNRRLRLQHATNPSFQEGPVAPSQWFTQTLDHSNPLETRTWQQQYLVNASMWGGDGTPIFLVIGGEGPISAGYVNGHFAVNTYAEQFNALVIGLEHRFYGQSIPTADSSPANLRYLSSQQALEDIVTFHDYIQAKYNAPNSKWIVFGGSYSGNLSGWLRYKYPHLFAGAIAASAPVQAQLDFPEYFNVVANSIGAECTNNLKTSTNELITLLNNNPTGRAQLQQMFNTCQPIVTDEDVITFLSDLTGGIAETVQYNLDNNGRHAYTIPQICSILESSSDPIDGLVQFTAAYATLTGQGGQCNDISYNDYIQSMLNTSDARSWTWQTCTEFGYFQSAEGSSQPFSPLISLQSFLQQCVDIFGIPNFSPNIQWTNDYYGGKNIKNSNVYMANGDVDPWHVLSVLPSAASKSNNTSSNSKKGSNTNMPYSQVHLIHGTAHCADLYAPSPNDLPELTSVRQEQVTYIQTWLSL